MTGVTDSSPPSAATASRRGRPRSEASHQAVMEATARLLDGERVPYEEVTVERIAAEAGVGKQTVYRWWQNKAAVVLEALLTGYLKLDFEPVPDTGDLRADLHRWVDSAKEDAEKHEQDSSTMARSLMAAIVTGGEDIQQLLRASDIWTDTHLAARFRSAQEAGQLREGADPVLLAAAVMAPMVIELITSGKPDGVWIKGLMDLLLWGALNDDRR